MSRVVNMQVTQGLQFSKSVREGRLKETFAQNPVDERKLVMRASARAWAKAWRCALPGCGRIRGGSPCGGWGWGRTARTLCGVEDTDT